MLAQDTSKPTDTVVILPSGINRLPAELLVEIFALCWRSFKPRFADIGTPSSISKELREFAFLAGIPLPDVYPENSTPAGFRTEIARLAHAPLLVVSQVCTKWRAIAMGASFLWCDIELDGALWDAPSHIITALGLLESTLTRGGNSPLNVVLTDGEHPFPAPVFDMLAAHSQRWQTFSCPNYMIDAFSGIQGKLPRLRSLEIDASDDDWILLENWGAMPSLTSLGLPGEILGDDLHKLPLEQLRQIECTTVDRHETQDAVSLMSLLPSATHFRLLTYLDEPEAWFGTVMSSPQSVTANISTFYLQLLGDFDTYYSWVVLRWILEGLTLPLLAKFELESDSYPRCPLLWPHEAFLALSAHSGFDSTLRSLEIYEAHITEVQLLQCLADLRSLERLAISDHEPVDRKEETRVGVGANEVLITDTLLAKLTRTIDSPCLVPRLSSLGCQTLLRFDDCAFLALAVSRLDDSDGCQNGGCFGLELSWLPGHERKIDDAVLTSFRDLKISTKRRFRFRMSAAEDEWV
ncbi:hypothetical protein B0H12DRAFT_210198 [Mycena haematopus]|nr:hypothetical protein B0H12DRAFT_210198 [Mycena haematopus]